MPEQKNLLLAMLAAMVILLGWNMLFPTQPAPRPATLEAQTPSTPTEVAPSRVTAEVVTREDALAASPRLLIETPRLKGSIALTGARFDDLVLKDYWQTVERQAQIALLNPMASENPYYAEFGWVGDGAPTAQTRWIADRSTLTPATPVTLAHDNGQGLVFRRTIAVDDDFMFTITQSVENKSDKPVTLAPYGMLVRTGTPEAGRMGSVVHEGPLGVFADKLEEFDYKDLREDRKIALSSTGGWLGITDKYWLTTLVPDQARAFDARFLYFDQGRDQYQADFREAPVTIAPGGSVKIENRFFAGAKEVGLIDRYESKYAIAKFDRTIDWGWFYPLTRPFFFFLDKFFHLFGSFGLAIIALTVLIRLVLFPLANKQFESMSRMKQVQPKMKALQERHKDDKPRLQKEMMELYKREKVNPLAGCLPILVQIPVFFSLYKVLSVTIEMRHAPFYGWIRDLSAPDPLTPVNLFGLLPFDPPAMLAIGIWPIVMGFSMWLQQRMNPAPGDPTQAMIMRAFPYVFTVILAPFAVGLVIYWTSNNLLSILQQWLIARRLAREPSEAA